MKSTITVDIYLNKDKVPEQINWAATDSTADVMQQAKATMLSFWDGAEKAALRIDLWTEQMMVDEMADFYYQTFMGMADTFERATHKTELVADMRKYAKEFYQKFREQELKENQAL